MKFNLFKNFHVRLWKGFLSTWLWPFDLVCELAKLFHLITTRIFVFYSVFLSGAMKITRIFVSYGFLVEMLWKSKNRCGKRGDKVPARFLILCRKNVLDSSGRFYNSDRLNVDNLLVDVTWNLVLKIFSRSCSHGDLFAYCLTDLHYTCGFWRDIWCWEELISNDIYHTRNKRNVLWPISLPS